MVVMIDKETKAKQLAWRELLLHGNAFFDPS
jgi:hypothetical protein